MTLHHVMGDSIFHPDGSVTYLQRDHEGKIMALDIPDATDSACEQVQEPAPSLEEVATRWGDLFRTIGELIETYRSK